VRLRAEHSNIVAVKHATGSIDGASRLARESDIIVLSGDDPLALPLMSVGACGVVSVLSNLLPAEMSALVRTALEGDHDTAREWHARLFDLMRGLMSLDTNPIPIKSALALRGWMTDEFRLPMCALSDSGLAALKDLLERYDGAKRARAGRRKAS